MLINLNITEISEGRGTLKQDIGPSSLAWGANVHQRVLEAGMTQIPHLLPLLSGAFPSKRELALAQVVPSRILTSPGHEAPLAPAPQTQHPSEQQHLLPDTPKQLNPNLSPVPHLTWGHQTPPPWAGPSTGDPSTLDAASAATSELIQQEKIYFLTVPPEVTTLLLLGSHQC